MRTAWSRVPLAASVGASGVFAWTVCVLLPSLHRLSALSPSAFVLMPLGPLALGVGLWLERSAPRAAPYALLTAFPITIALSVSRFDHDTALATFSPGVLGFALLSLAAYGTAASALCSRPAAVREVDHRPLGEVAPVDPETRKQKLGSVVLTVITVGALLVLIWGSWGTPARFREQWGRAAPQGATLTALLAGIAGALAISFVGPALRAERSAPKSPEERRKRVMWLLLVAASGAAVYVFLRAR